MKFTACPACCPPCTPGRQRAFKRFAEKHAEPAEGQPTPAPSATAPRNATTGISNTLSRCPVVMTTRPKAPSGMVEVDDATGVRSDLVFGALPLEVALSDVLEEVLDRLIRVHRRPRARERLGRDVGADDARAPPETLHA